MADGKVVISTELDNRKIKNGVSDIKGQLGGLSSVAKKLGGVIAAAFSVRAIVAFSKECLELGSNLQEVQNVVDVTFTTMNEQVNAFAKNAAKTAGLSETIAKQYTGTFGAMAKSFGFTESEAYAVATSLTQLTGDVASFYNLSQDAAYTKLKSVFSGETESLKDLGVVMTQSALDAFALEKGLGRTTQQMTEQEKVALRYRFVVEQLSAASGDFVRTSDSWANQTRLLNLQFEQLKATVGQGLIAALTPVIRMLNELIGYLQAAADAFANFMNAVFNAGGSSALAAAGTGLAEGVGAAASASGDLASNAASAAGSAAKIKKTLSGFDELNVLGDASGGGGAGGGAASNIGKISVSVPDTETESATPTALQQIIDKIKEFSSQVTTVLQPAAQAWTDAFRSLEPAANDAASRIGAALSALWDGSLAPFFEYVALDWIPGIATPFSETFAPIFADIMPVALEAFTGDFENSCKLVEEYCSILETAFEGVKTVFSDMCESVSASWDAHSSGILQGMLAFRQGIWDTVWDMFDNIARPVTEMVGETLAWLWDEHLKPLWDDIVSFVMSVQENLLALWNTTLKPLVDAVVSFLAPLITNAIGIVADAVAVAVAFISDAVGAILTFLDGLIQFVVGVFTLDWERAWGGIKKAFEGIWNAIAGVVKGAINSIIWAINAFIAAIYSAIAAVINGLGGIVRTVGNMLGKSWGFSVPSAAPRIPYLAQGAVLPANKPFMAVVGDQRHGTNVEAPLETIQEAVALVMSDYAAEAAAGQEAQIAVLREILDAIGSIRIGDDTIYNAADRYRRKMAVARGEAL